MTALALQVAQRAADLVERFRHIGATRMAGIPICNPRLQVAAVGFEPLAGSGGAAGVLVTPWFMNLVWFAIDGSDPAVEPLAAGRMRDRAVGAVSFPFIGACEAGFGPFEACSLFSPMDDFVDQAAALATAGAVLAELRPAQPQQPARRRFLLGGAGEGRAAG